MKTSLKRRPEKIVYYFVVFAALFDNNTMWSFLTRSPLYGRGFGWGLGACCLLAVLLSKRFSKDYRVPLMMLVIFSGLSVYALATRYKVPRFYIGYVGVWVCLFLFSVSLYENKKMRVFLSAYSNVMLIIAVVSLVFWVFGSLLQIMPGRKAVIYDWADDYRTSYTYYYLYFENPIQNKGQAYIRNLGVFPEAPAYASFLIYGMLIEIVNRKDIFKRSKKARRSNLLRIAIYFVTLLSTGSSKGIIAVLAVIAIEYLFKRSKKAWKQVVKTIVCIVAFFVVAIASIYLIEVKLPTASGIARVDDLLAGLKTWKQHFLFGAGYMNGDALRANWTVLRNNEGISMGLAVLLAYGGLFFLLFYSCAAVYALFGNYFRHRKKAWVIVCVVLLFDLFISNGAFDIPFIFLIAAAYASPHKGKNGIAFLESIQCSRA